MLRRTVLGGSVAGLAGLATWAYRTAPTFWNQYTEDLKRDILAAPAHPDPRRWPDKGLHAAWLGHSTVLVKADGVTILTDPVFSNRVGLNLGPVTLGMKRLVAPALGKKDVPTPDLIVLSHAHMDHLDVPSLRALENKQTRIVAASRTSDLFRAERFQEAQELAWGETKQLGPVSVRGLEVNHWGARMRSDTYRGYNGYLLEVGRYRILFGGDTANTDAFRRLKSSQRVDLAIMPIGAYDPWIRYHCTPEQAWRMGQEAGAEHLLPVHHQTFKLSREPFTEPIERFQAAAGGHPDRVAVHAIGQEFHIS